MFSIVSAHSSLSYMWKYLRCLSYLKCSNTLYLFQDKLNKTNTLFWRAVDKTRNLPHNINLIIPPGFCQDQNYNRTRRVQGSAFITSSPSSIVQPGACGEPGYQLNVGFTNSRRNRQLNENLENMVYLTRFLYGVFPEHGVESSSRFPLFYRNRSEVSSFIFLQVYIEQDSYYILRI